MTTKKHKKPYAQLAAEGDAKRQKACGWGPGAWVGIEFPRPRNDVEKRALALLNKRYPNAIAVHVYSLVDFITEILNDTDRPTPRRAKASTRRVRTR